MRLRFTWDLRKALANQAKHGISFEEAVSAFSASFPPDSQRGENVSTMKKPSTERPATRTRKTATAAHEPAAEYDFSRGVRGKYTNRLPRGAALVVLEPDVAAAFPDDEAVNRALRAIMEVAPRPRRATSRRAREA